APAPVPAPAPAPAPEPAPEAAATAAVSFASGDPAISLVVKCGDSRQSGATVRFAAAPLGPCKVEGRTGDTALVTIVAVTGDRSYTCFGGGQRSCQ
ncbi:MAG TPA: hypothetical protein PKW90_28960, partial [Myxococcota bacterium]|nr:hypothetical protein [Myxococcota bacterium]